MPERPVVLSLQSVDASYNGAVQVLRGVSLQVRQGEVVALLGPNGAGKSTVLKAISNLLLAENGRVTAGEVRFAGERIDGLDPSVAAQRGLAHVMEGRRLFPNLTVVENLRTGALRRSGRTEIAQDLERVMATFPRLGGRARVKAGLLSGGEQQMVAIGRALMAKPRLILLDEPSMGLAPLVVAEIFAIVRQLRDTGEVAILLAEQNVAAALSIVNHAYVLENGSVGMQGTIEELGGRDVIARSYLGVRQPAAAATHDR